MNTPPIVLIIIALTGLFTYQGFQNYGLFDRYKFLVGPLKNKVQQDRLLTSGFLHVDWTHFIFNMLTLFFFSDIVIYFFARFFENLILGQVAFLVLYLISILLGNILSLFFHGKEPQYAAVGASGGVSGILFATVMINPEMGIYIFFIPIAIPAWIFTILYLAYSVYGMRSNLGNIGHAAHLGGAATGMIAMLAIQPQLFFNNQLYITLMFLPIMVLGYLAWKRPF